jgi:Domain of unknown function (DUF5753)/Helix-turn-helix domain
MDLASEVDRMPEFASPMLRRWELGNALRRLREERQMTIADVTAAMKERYGSSFSTTKLSRMETAKRGVIPRDVHDLCVLYDVPDEERERLMELAKSSRDSEKIQADNEARGYLWYIALEQIAAQVREYSSMFIPGLLQTAEYATAVENLTLLSPTYYYLDLPVEELPDTAEGRSQLRLERQKLLEKADPLQLHVIVDEGALHRRLPVPGVMKRQLRRLLDVSTREHIRIQVMAFEAGIYPGSETAHWQIVDFPPGDQYPPRTVYLESPTGSRIYEQETVVRAMSDTFETLTKLALNPLESRSLVERAMNDHSD